MAAKKTSSEKTLPTSVRFTPEVNDKLVELMKIFEESAAKVLSRGVEMLYENRVSVVEEEAARKIRKARGESE